jgi:hypothetical protein
VIELDAEGDADAAEGEDEEIELDIEMDDEEPEFDTEEDEEIEIELGDEEGEEDVDFEEEDEDVDFEEEEDEEEPLNEENLGYTDSYQKDVFAKKPNMSEPAKGMNDWDEGVPTGSEKPWAGKGNMKPFGEEKQELEENQTASKAQRRKVVKTLAPNSGETDKPEVSKEVSVAGQLSEDKARKIINAAKAIQAENK